MSLVEKKENLLLHKNAITKLPSDIVLCEWCQFHRRWYQKNWKKCWCVIKCFKNINLAVNTGKTKCMDPGCHRGIMAYHGKCEKVKIFECLGSLFTNQNSIHEKIKCRFKSGNSYYYSIKKYRLHGFSLIIWKLKFIAVCETVLLAEIIKQKFAGSIHGTSKILKLYMVWNEVHPASWEQLIEK